jgi:hypothetical protein
MGVLWDKVRFDLWHRKARTLLAVLSIAAGVFAIGAMFGLADQMLSGMNEAHQSVNPSHLNIILRRPIDRETAAALTDIPGVVGVEPLNIATVRYKTAPDQAEWQAATIVARDDFENQTFDHLELKAGEWPIDTRHRRRAHHQQLLRHRDGRRDHLRGRGHRPRLPRRRSHPPPVRPPAPVRRQRLLLRRAVDDGPLRLPGGAVHPATGAGGAVQRGVCPRPGRGH